MLFRRGRAGTAGPPGWSGAACNWAFLSALISLQDRAKSVEANAVVNIASYYKKVEVRHETMYECHKGGLMAGVALKGDVVRVAR